MTLTDQKSKELQEKYKLSTQERDNVSCIHTMRNGCYVSISREELEAFGLDFIIFEEELKRFEIQYTTTPGNPYHYYKFQSLPSANLSMGVIIRMLHERECSIESKQKFEKSHLQYACPFCEEVFPREAVKQRIKAGKDFLHCPECGELVRL